MDFFIPFTALEETLVPASNVMPSESATSLGSRTCHRSGDSLLMPVCAMTNVKSKSLSSLGSLDTDVVELQNHMTFGQGVKVHCMHYINYDERYYYHQGEYSCGLVGKVDSKLKGCKLKSITGHGCFETLWQFCLAPPPSPTLPLSASGDTKKLLFPSTQYLCQGKSKINMQPIMDCIF